MNERRKTYNYIGDKMRKYCIILIGVIAILLLFWFLRTIQNPMASLSFSSEGILYDCSEKEVEELLSLDLSLIKEFRFLRSLSNFDYETIFVAQCEEVNRAAIDLAVDQYCLHLYQRFPTKKKEIKSQIQRYDKGEYYIVVISKNADTIIEEIKERLAIA